MAGAMTLNPFAQQPPSPAAGERPVASATVQHGSTLSFLRWRSIGPDRGGRSLAVSGVKGKPREAYFGAVAVSESNPDVVFIGMGESRIRGNIMPGDDALRVVNSGDGKPIANASPIFKDVTAELKVHTDRLQQVITRDLTAFNAEAKRAGLSPVPERSR